MSGLFLVGLRVVVGFVLVPVFIKIAVTGEGRVKRFTLQFTAALLFALLFSIWSGGLSLDRWVMVSFLIGALSAFGAYCQWRSMDLSMSRYGLFTWLDDIIAIGLGYVFLFEDKFLNLVMVVGIVIAFISIILFIIRDARRKKTGEEHIQPSFYLWSLGYCCAFGIVIFLIRVLARTWTPKFAYQPCMINRTNIQAYEETSHRSRCEGANYQSH